MNAESYAVDTITQTAVSVSLKIAGFAAEQGLRLSVQIAKLLAKGMVVLAALVVSGISKNHKTKGAVALSRIAKAGSPSSFVLPRNKLEQFQSLSKKLKFTYCLAVKKRDIGNGDIQVFFDMAQAPKLNMALEILGLQGLPRNENVLAAPLMEAHQNAGEKKHRVHGKQHAKPKTEKSIADIPASAQPVEKSQRISIYRQIEAAKVEQAARQAVRAAAGIITRTTDTPLPVK